MSQKYFTTLTHIGAALHANAQLQQTTVPWTHLVLGDGNGVETVPSPAQTGVIREVDQLAISSIEPDPNNPNWIVIEAVIPADRGGYVVRETALMGGANSNQCIAVGNYPSATKPLLSEGAGSELVIRVVVEIAHTATVTLKIDPAVVIASRDWVEKLRATESKSGLVELATEEEVKAGTDTGRVITPKTLAETTRIDSTETERGMPMVATQAEVNAGTDDAKVVTPKKLRAGFEFSFSAGVGFVAFPTWMGGFVIQAGANGVTGSTQSFPIAFPAELIAIVGSHAGGSYAGISFSNAQTGRSTFRGARDPASTVEASFRWIAFGR